MYSIPDFYLVANPIDRYSIGDRTPGIVYDHDGALTLTINHTASQRPHRPSELATRTRRRVPAGAPDVRTRRFSAGPDLYCPPITKT